MKTARHTRILELVQKADIETQDELADILRRDGFQVTQATISRDIKELRLVKVLSSSGVYKYATVHKAESGLMDRFIRMFSESVLSMASAGNLVVLKTISGSANVAAEAVDAMKWPEIVGTIAGDNTIFVAVSKPEYVNEVISKFKGIMK
ncbi:MAG: arginine repressor [Christensenellales bacterium]|jgi:transcriptional regulator of arginine metabolism